MDPNSNSRSFLASISEAFRVDLAKKTPIKDRLESYIQAMENVTRSYGDGEADNELRSDDLGGDNKPLIPGVSVTGSRIKAMYSKKEDTDNDGTYGDKVVCVLKLCLAEIACGETSVTVEEHFRRVSIALELDETPQCIITNKSLTAQFGSGPVVMIECYRDLLYSKLRDVSVLSVLMQQGYTKNAKAACLVVDNIMEEKDPYGWAVVDIGVLAVNCVGCIAQFNGTWEDMAATAYCSIIWLPFRRLIIRRYHLIFGPIEVLLVCFITGVVSSIIWRYVYSEKELLVCHIFIVFLSSTYIYVPGSEIVFGAYEVFAGNYIHGSSRMIGALIRLMFMSFGLLIGWQTFGRGQIQYEDDSSTIVNSLLLGDYCPAFTEGVFSIEPWWLVTFVFNLVVTPLALMLFNVRPRDMLIPGITTYVALALNMILYTGCNLNTCTQLPSYINNTIVLFVAANVAYLFDYLYDQPAVNSLMSAILMFAPGSSTIVKILNQMGREHGVTDESLFSTTSDLFANVAMKGVSYALGIILASSYWSIIISKKDMKRCESMQKKKVFFSYQGPRN